jgi:hypothetical protein
MSLRALTVRQPHADPILRALAAIWSDHAWHVRA